MVTFTQWAKGQADRQDAVGYFTRYWDSVTPGKISSVVGVRRFLETIEHDRKTRGKPDEMSDAAWDKAGVSLEAAKSGLELAVAEYTRMRAVENANAHGLQLAPEQPPLMDASEAHSPEQVIRLDPGQLTVSASPEGTGKPADGVSLTGSGTDLRITRPGSSEERLGRIERLLTMLAESHKAQNDLLKLIYAELVVHELDWDELWAIASRAPQETA